MRRWTLPVLLALSMVFGGVAVAQVSSKLIVACASKTTGDLRITRSGRCDDREYRVSWNEQGPPGPQGEEGPVGPQGPQGPPAGPACPPQAEPTSASFDGYVFLPGIDGNAQDAAHADWWVLTDFDLGLARCATDTKQLEHVLTVTVDGGAKSTALLDLVLNGTKFPNDVVIEVCATSPTGVSECLQRLELADAALVHVDYRATDQDTRGETYQVTFSHLTYEVAGFDGGPTWTATWDPSGVNAPTAPSGCSPDTGGYGTEVHVTATELCGDAPMGPHVDWVEVGDFTHEFGRTNGAVQQLDLQLSGLNHSSSAHLLYRTVSGLPLTDFELEHGVTNPDDGSSYIATEILATQANVTSLAVGPLSTATTIQLGKTTWTTADPMGSTTLMYDFGNKR